MSKCLLFSNPENHVHVQYILLYVYIHKLYILVNGSTMTTVRGLCSTLRTRHSFAGKLVIHNNVCSDNSTIIIISINTNYIMIILKI